MFVEILNNKRHFRGLLLNKSLLSFLIPDFGCLSRLVGNGVS